MHNYKSQKISLHTPPFHIVYIPDLFSWVQLYIPDFLKKNRKKKSKKIPEMKRKKEKNQQN
jgi:hypothetical protein